MVCAVTVGAMPGQVIIDAATTRAFVNNYQGQSVSLLDARSGAVLRTIGVGCHPISLTVDETTTRLFEVNTNAGCVGRDPFGWMPGSIRQRLLHIFQPPKPRCALRFFVSRTVAASSEMC